MLISCHIPKTAGLSFATALSEAFGEGFLWDRSQETIVSAMYEENRVPAERIPIRWLCRYKPPSKRNAECIHGHFPLGKYLLWAFDRKNIFIVWLREPLQWRISLYYFLKQNYPHPSDKYLNSLFDNNCDLEKFCTDPTFDDYQSRYLARFPRRRIDFIGVTENYASDLAYISRHILRRNLSFCKINQTRKPAGLLDEGFSDEFRNQFESRNQIDYRNYRTARCASDARSLEFRFNQDYGGGRTQPQRARAA
jgi:hypothetical protein